jgi:hypothetical protein
MFPPMSPYFFCMSSGAMTWVRRIDAVNPGATISILAIIRSQ